MTSGRANLALKNMQSFAMQQQNDHGQASFWMKSVMACIPAGPVGMNSLKLVQNLILAVGGRLFTSPSILMQSFCVTMSP
jgi:undecaprenyl pyrophosphate phosphatase UppP